MTESTVTAWDQRFSTAARGMRFSAIRRMSALIEKPGIISFAPGQRDEERARPARAEDEDHARGGGQQARHGRAPEEVGHDQRGRHERSEVRARTGGGLGGDGRDGRRIRHQGEDSTNERIKPPTAAGSRRDVIGRT